MPKKAFAINNREREIILFALELLKSNLDEDAQEYLADRFQASSGPDEDPNGSEGVPSEVEEREIEGLVRRIEGQFGVGRGGRVRLNPAGKLTESKVRGLIKRGLRDRDWSADFAETVVDSIEQIDALWSYGSVKAVKDVAEIYSELEAEHGEPPDVRV